MSRSATMQTDMSWNKPGSLGFSIAQRHIDASMTGRGPLIRERTGGLRTAFERHGEFAGKALARMAARSVPGNSYGRDSHDMKFVHVADRGGRPHTPGAMKPGVREPAVMRYSGVPALTEPGRLAEEKSASALIPDTAADPKQTAGMRMAHVQQMQQVQRVQRVQRLHMAPASIHRDGSLSGSAISRGGHDEFTALPGFRRFDSDSVPTVEVRSESYRSGEQEEGSTVAETVLSPVQPERAGIPAVLARAPIVSGPAASGNTGSGLRGPSGNVPRFPSRDSAAPAPLLMRRLSSAITAGQHQLLAPDCRIPGISGVSRGSGVIARQRGLDAARPGSHAGQDRHIDFHGGAHIRAHIGTEAEKSGLSVARSSWGKSHQPAARTGVEARAESDSIFRPDLEQGAPGDQAVPAPGGADRGHARAYVARAGAQHPLSFFSASGPLRREAMALRSPFRIAPARRGDAVHSPQQALPGSGNFQVNAEYSPDYSVVSAHQPLRSASVPVQVSRNDDGDDNAPGISRKAIPENADAPGNRGTMGHTHSLSDPIVLPAVLPASLSTAILRQAAVRRLPDKAGAFFPLQSRESPFGGLAAHSGGHAPSRLGRDPVAEVPEQAAGSMAKDQGIRHGNPQQSHFSVLRAALPAVHRSTPATGGNGSRSHFPASVSGLARLARETISVRGTTPQPYLNRLSGLAESPLSKGISSQGISSQGISSKGISSKGISGRDAVMASFMTPPSAHSGAAGELRAQDAVLHRTAIAGPATVVSSPGSTAIPVIHAPAAVDGELQPAAMPSSPDHREEMQRQPDFSSAESPGSFPASRAFAKQAIARRTVGGGMAMQRHAGVGEGMPASPSRAASGRMDTTVRPLVLAHGMQHVRQLQRMVAAIGEGESARGGITRLTGEAYGASTHSFPLARRETPEDQYGVVPAPHRGPGGIHGVPDNEGTAAESSAGKPDADEMAEQAWRLISERLVIEQERRGLTQWHR